MADTPFINWAFPASGATASRDLPDRLSDVINIRDYGVNPDPLSVDYTNNHDKLQLCFDIAFGSNVPGTVDPDGNPLYPPHGANSHLNRPVYIPRGQYNYNGTINMTGVVGGLVYGDSGGVSILRNLGSPGITINGCVGTMFRDFGVAGSGITLAGTSTGIYLDWNGDVDKVGLRDITFYNVSVGGARYAMRVLPSNIAGAGKNISLLACPISQAGTGLLIEGDDCAVTCLGCATSECWTGTHVLRGSLTNSGISNAGSTAAGPQQLDFKMDSSKTLIVYGGRSECSYFCDITAGNLIAQGVLAQGGQIHGRAIDVGAGATVNLISCDFGAGSYTADTDGFITGSGNVYIKNVRNTYGLPINLKNFTGKICQYAGPDTFKFAQLPPAVDGLILPVSDAPASLGWGGVLFSANATGNFLFSAQPADNSTITLNGTLVTMHDGTSGTVDRGADRAACVDNLVTFLNASADTQIAKCTYSASGSPHDRLVLASKTTGTTMNGFTLARSTSPASNATITAMAGGVVSRPVTARFSTGTGWTVVGV